MWGKFEIEKKKRRNTSTHLIRVDASIIDKVGVVNLGVDPLALVGRVVNLAGLPLALVLGVVNHRGLPLAVHVIVPVLGLLGLRVRDVLGLVPIGRLLVLGVGNGLGINPVRRLALAGVVDLARQQERPVVVQRAGLDLVVVNAHLVRVVGLDNQRVQVARLVSLAGDGLLAVQVLALVREDDVDLWEKVASMNVSDEMRTKTKAKRNNKSNNNNYCNNNNNNNNNNYYYCNNNNTSQSRSKHHTPTTTNINKHSHTNPPCECRGRKCQGRT